jgi:hypothetical protein
MRKQRSVLMAAVAAAVLAAATSAYASITFKYTTYTGTTPGSNPNFVGAVGTPIVIPIYLYEQLTSGSTDTVVAPDGGLGGAAFSVTQTTNTAAGTLSGITGNTTSFPGGLSNPAGGNSSTSQAFGSSTNIQASSGPVPNASGDVQIGSITVTPTATGTNTYVLANFNYPSTKSDDVTGTFGITGGPSGGNGFDLDPNNTGEFAFTGAIANPETFTVTVPAVPEPATISLLGVSALGILSRRRKLA